MYIEVFLLDNLLMNLLVLRLASAMLSVKSAGKRTVPFAALGAACAALGAGGASFLFTAPAKLALTLVMSFALPGRGLRARALAFLALLLSAFTAGGAVLLVQLLAGRAGSSPSTGSGALLIGAVFTAFLPHIIRRILSRRLPEGSTVRFEAEFSGDPPVMIECAALVDTGNLLTEPVSALPVIVLPKRLSPALAEKAGIPIPIRTASGSGLLFAIRPRRVLVNGESVSALVAFSASRTALVPACLASAERKSA